jgi:hypothetical protein
VKRKNGIPTPGDTLATNGAVVLAVRPYERGLATPGATPSTAWVVLCYWSSSATPLVTWVYESESGGCVWGHYHHEGQLEKAYVDFATRGPVECWFKKEEK